MNNLIKLQLIYGRIKPKINKHDISAIERFYKYEPRNDVFSLIIKCNEEKQNRVIKNIITELELEYSVSFFPGPNFIKKPHNYIIPWYIDNNNFVTNNNIYFIGGMEIIEHRLIEIILSFIKELIKHDYYFSFTTFEGITLNVYSVKDNNLKYYFQVINEIISMINDFKHSIPEEKKKVLDKKYWLPKTK